MQTTTGEKRKRDDDEQTKGQKFGKRPSRKHKGKRAHDDADVARRLANRGAENRTHYSPILKLA
eukprot:3284830-Heterocapsa_arctica.AAC.1